MNEIKLVVAVEGDPSIGLARERQRVQSRMRQIQDDVQTSTRQIETQVTDTGRRAGAGLASGLGDGAQDGARGLLSIKDAVTKVETDIGRLESEARDLARQFASTGDKDALKGLRDTRSVIAGLQSVRRSLGDVDDAAADAGDSSDRRFRDRLSSGMRSTFETLPKVLGPTAIAAGAAIGISLAGAVAPAAIAAIPMGMAGIGAAITASTDQQVKQAGMTLVEQLKAMMADAAEPLEGPVLHAIERIGHEATAMGPELKSMFADLGPVIDEVVDGAIGFVRGVMPGIRDSINDSMPAIQALSDGAASLGRDVGTAMSIISGGSKDGADGLRMLIDAIGDVTIVTAGLVRATEEVGQSMGAWPLLAKGVSGAADKIREWTGHGNDAAKAMQADAEHSRTLTRQLHHQSDALRGLNAATMEHNQLALAAADADIAFQQAVDDATGAIKDNGRTLDINTQKGRDNKSALLQIAGSAVAAAQSVKDLGGSQESATRRLNDGYTAFVRAAHGAGMTKEAADRLARSYGLLPPVKETHVKAPGAKSAKHDVDQLRSSISRLHGKDVFVTTHFVTRGGGAGSVIGQHAMAKGGITGAQSGGPRAGLTEVAEQGREIALLAPGVAQLPPGSQVIPNGRTEQLLGSGGRREPLELIIKSGGTRLEDLLVEILRDNIQFRYGGDVNLALGQAS